jgi:hypothetical protein
MTSYVLPGLALTTVIAMVAVLRRFFGSTYAACCALIGLSFLPAAVVVDFSIDVLSRHIPHAAERLDQYRIAISAIAAVTCYVSLCLRFISPSVTGVCVCRHELWKPAKNGSVLEVDLDQLSLLELITTGVESMFLVVSCCFETAVRIIRVAYKRYVCFGGACVACVVRRWLSR